MERLAVPLLGLILAGGNSSRMGQDKALLNWKGRLLLQHIYHCAAAVCPRVYVITPRSQIYRPLLPPDCGFIPEQGQQQGPLRAFQEAMECLDPDLDPGLDLDLEPTASAWMLLLSCDLPNLRAAALAEWWQQIAPLISPPEEPLENSPITSPIAYVPRNPEGWWEPLCGFYGPQCRSSLARFLQQGGRSFQHWLNQERVAALPVKDPALLFNLNTYPENPEVP